VLIAWSILFPPPSRQAVPAPPAGQVAGAAATAPAAPGESGIAPAPGGAAAAAPSSGMETSMSAGPTVAGAAPEPIAANHEESVIVETGLSRIELTNKGGRALSWTLEKF